MLSPDPLERLSRVVVNLGLGDVLKAGELTLDHVEQVIKCIRSADQWAITHGGTAFPMTDEEIRDRLLRASWEQGADRWIATAFKRHAETKSC